MSQKNALDQIEAHCDKIFDLTKEAEIGIGVMVDDDNPRQVIIVVDAHPDFTAGVIVKIKELEEDWQYFLGKLVEIQKKAD